MMVLIQGDIERGYPGKERTWIESGSYEVVREFNATHWLINLSKPDNLRVLTIVKKKDCVEFSL